MSGVTIYVKEVSRIPIRRLLYSRDGHKYPSRITKLYRHSFTWSLNNKIASIDLAIGL